MRSASVSHGNRPSALPPVDVRVLDHFIVTCHRVASMAEMGLV